MMKHNDLLYLDKSKVSLKRSDAMASGLTATKMLEVTPGMWLGHKFPPVAARVFTGQAMTMKCGSTVSENEMKGFIKVTVHTEKHTHSLQLV